MIAQLAAAALLASQSAAAAQAPRCVAQQDVDDLLLTFAPHLIQTVGSRCQSFAGSTPFITSADGRAFVERARSDAVPRLPGALRALETISGERIPGGAIGRLAVVAFLGTAVNDVVDELTETKCRAADRAVASLAPLPPASIASAFGALMLFAQDEERNERRRPLICTDETRK